jgi:hypothetical protein
VHCCSSQSKGSTDLLDEAVAADIPRAAAIVLKDSLVSLPVRAIYAYFMGVSFHAGSLVPSIVVYRIVASTSALCCAPVYKYTLLFGAQH